jgi:hypothetical protein
MDYSIVLMHYSLHFFVPFQTVLSELSKEVGSKVNIENFMRIEIGEGIAR